MWKTDLHLGFDPMQQPWAIAFDRDGNLVAMNYDVNWNVFAGWIMADADVAIEAIGCEHRVPSETSFDSAYPFIHDTAPAELSAGARGVSMA